MSPKSQFRTGVFGKGLDQENAVVGQRWVTWDMTLKGVFLSQTPAISLLPGCHRVNTFLLPSPLPRYLCFRVSQPWGKTLKSVSQNKTLPTKL